MLGTTSRHKCDHSRDTGRAFGHEIAQEEEQYIYDMDLYINRHDRDLDNHRNNPGIEFQIQQEAHRYARSMADAYRKATLSQDNSQGLDEDVFHDFDSSSSESRYSYAVEELTAVSRSLSPTFPTTPTPMMALKPLPTTAFVSSPVPVSKKTSSSAVRAAASSPATSASSKTTNTDPKRHSNATSRGSARRIIYSADVEQGLPEGHIAREGKFEIVPSSRLSNTSSRATGNRSSRLGGRGVIATSTTAVLETGTDYEESTVVVRTDRKGKGKAIAVSEDNNQITHGHNRKSRYGLNDLEEQEQEQHHANIRQDEDPCGTGYKVEIDVDMVAMVARMNANITELETAI
ncbi:hypothetical protein BGZ51_007566 [Haplosporangium sp. Z 767]|nr:hypothetical protein BGZ51_007566 [Haplosporangium sp. Z 767]KAF9191716.1 hypothetical protein BGZ50_009189 [Haplosporangium sp. Z 11]